MIQSVDRVVLALVSELVASGARSIVLAGVAAAGLALFRPKATSLRLFTWTAVLYASLALPLLGWLLPPVQVSAPQFLQHSMARTTPVSVEKGRSASTLASDAATSSPEHLAGHYRLATVAEHPTRPETVNAIGESPSSVWATVPWTVVAAWIYVLVTLFFLARFVAGIIVSGTLVRSSRSIGESLAVEKFVRSARGSTPRLATSDRISVPVTVGAFWSTVLLPSDWREWDAEKLDAVLAHEFSHVVRRDALTQRISLLYRAIFWFNPLAWWMNRHLSALAEQASDEAALSGGADQNHYARTLLGFFEVLQTAPRRIRWQGVSMARPGQAEQRLERILSWKGTVSMNLKRSLAIVILVLAVPVVYLAASVHPANARLASSNAGQWQEPVPPAAPSAPAVRGVSTAAPAGGVGSMPPAPPIAPVAPEASMAALAPVAPGWNGRGQRHSSGTGSGNGYAYGFDDEERFVIVSGKSDSFTMSGSSQDARHVEKLKKQIPGGFIWFQRDEKSYIIRDQATIDRAHAFWAPQEELGKKQEELGKQQEVLGKQQEELGSKMEQVRVNVPDMTAALDKLKVKLQKLGASATMEQIGDLQSEIGELQSKIGEIQSNAGEEQSKLGELQGELGEKQGKLGEQQGELGRQQGELAEKATHQMKELLDEAIKNGTAKPEEETVKTPTL